MDNKKDWEELEKWNNERMEKDKEKFGSYLDNHDDKSVDKMVKGLNIMTIGFKIIKYLLIITITVIAVIFTSMAISNLNSHTTVDVYNTIKDKYKMKVNTISEDIDDKKDGIYKLEVKDNSNIKFTAIKKGNQLQEDLSDNSHKYYFESWDNPNKNVFTVVENYNNNLLEYQTYIEIDNEEELKESMKLINELINTCGNENFYLTWNIYLKKGEYRIYPYEGSGTSNEEATQKAIEKYNSYFK